MRWDNMKLFGLFRISIGATDLVLLVLDAMPGLKHLEIGQIILSQGSWEGVFEAFKQMHRLCVFQISPHSYLFQDGGRVLLWECFVHSRVERPHEDLNTHVLYGGRHPCLRSGKSDSAAKEYKRCLEPELRQRFLDLDCSSS